MSPRRKQYASRNIKQLRLAYECYLDICPWQKSKVKLMSELGKLAQPVTKLLLTNKIRESNPEFKIHDPEITFAENSDELHQLKEKSDYYKFDLLEMHKIHQSQQSAMQRVTPQVAKERIVAMVLSQNDKDSPVPDYVREIVLEALSNRDATFFRTRLPKAFKEETEPVNRYELALAYYWTPEITSDGQFFIGLCYMTGPARIEFMKSMFPNRCYGENYFIKGWRKLGLISSKTPLIGPGNIRSHNNILYLINDE